MDTVPAGLLLWPRCISERRWLGGESLPASVESRGSRRMGDGTSLPTCRYLARWACSRRTYTLEPEQLREKGPCDVCHLTSCPHHTRSSFDHTHSSPLYHFAGTKEVFDDRWVAKWPQLESQNHCVSWRALWRLWGLVDKYEVLGSGGYNQA